MSKPITDGLQFKFLVLALRLREKGKTLDERYEQVLVEQVEGSGLSKAAILGQDAVYDRDGTPDWDRTSFYVPNVRDRLLHGSDFPFPAAPTAFSARIGEDAAKQIDREKNWLKKDLDLKEALGVGLDSAKRAFQVAKAGLP